MIVAERDRRLDFTYNLKESRTATWVSSSPDDTIVEVVATIVAQPLLEWSGSDRRRIDARADGGSPSSLGAVMVVC